MVWDAFLRVFYPREKYSKKLVILRITFVNVEFLEISRGFVFINVEIPKDRENMFI